MNKFCFLVMLAWAVMSCNPSKTTVNVHINGGPLSQKVSLMTKDSTYSMSLDSTGTALFTLAENLKPGYATLAYGRMQVPVYVEPRNSFDVSITIEGRNVDTKFAGEGAKKNEYLNSKTLRRYFPDFKADEVAFLGGIKTQEDQLVAMLDSMNFDESFKQMEKKRIHYMLYSMMTSYPSYHAYYTQDRGFKPSENFYNEMKAAIQEEEALLDMKEYMAALSGFVSLYSNKDLVSNDPLAYTKNNLNYVQQNISSPALASILVDQYASEYVGRYGVDHLDEIAPIYNAKVTCPDKKAEFDKICNQWARIAKGQPSPDFKYMDINGKEVSLADLAGKYVYIDVWATWCGPCRGELPHLKELENKYKGKNIHFVSISCDQDKAAWEKMVKDDKLEGIQLHTGGDRNFMEAYRINGIPRFILLDREGKIIDANMSRPSDPQTVKTFNSLQGI